MAKLGVWVCSALLTLGCGGHAASSGAREGDTGAEANAGRGGASQGGGGASQGGGGASQGGGGASQGGGAVGTLVIDGAVGPWFNPPSPEGDGRLPDIPETPPGEPGIGWDFCPAAESLFRSDCADCASRGSDFLIAEDSLEVSLEAQRPHLYVYVDPPQSAGALWFDVASFDGARVAELMVWETNAACEPVSEGRLFDLSRLLTASSGVWKSGCIALDETRKFSGLGLRLGAGGRVGLDAIRLGVACEE